MKLSKIDVKLVNELLKNSKQSYHQLAKKLKVSAATIMKHVKTLEDNKVVTKYTISVDYAQLGYDIYAIIDLRISKGKLFLVEKKIATHPNVTAVYDNTGQFDASIMTRFKNTQTLDKFLKLIQSYDFVERTETKIILNTIKKDSIVVRA